MPGQNGKTYVCVICQMFDVISSDVIWCYLLWMERFVEWFAESSLIWPHLTRESKKPVLQWEIKHSKMFLEKLKKTNCKKIKCVCPNPIGWNSAKYSARFFWLFLKPKSLKLNEITKKYSTVRLIEKLNSRIVRDKNWDVFPWFSAMWVGGSKFYNSETGNPT